MHEATVIGVFQVTVIVVVPTPKPSAGVWLHVTSLGAGGGPPFGAIDEDGLGSGDGAKLATAVGVADDGLAEAIDGRPRPSASGNTRSSTERSIPRTRRTRLPSYW
jgi:hypothetical protein